MDPLARTVARLRRRQSRSAPGRGERGTGLMGPVPGLRASAGERGLGTDDAWLQLARDPRGRSRVGRSATNARWSAASGGRFKARLPGCATQRGSEPALLIRRAWKLSGSRLVVKCPVCQRSTASSDQRPIASVGVACARRKAVRPWRVGEGGAVGDSGMQATANSRSGATGAIRGTNGGRNARLRVACRVFVVGSP
jgi:hypothetical protein